MINSLSMTRMSATISVHARNSTLSKPNKSCSSCYSCSISPSLQFQNDHSHHLQQYLGNTLETIVLLIPKAATAGKVSILWPNHLAGLNGFPNGWCIGMGLCMYIYRCISRGNMNPWYTTKPSFELKNGGFWRCGGFWLCIRSISVPGISRLAMLSSMPKSSHLNKIHNARKENPSTPKQRKQKHRKTYSERPKWIY